MREVVGADGAVRTYEENGFRLFLYNRSYEPARRRIGLRYNETWVTDAAAFYTQPEAAAGSVLLDSFVLDSAAFARDWRDAAAVPPLRATCPPVPERLNVLRGFNVAGPEIEEPITFDGPLRAVVTEDRDLTTYHHPTPETDDDFGTTYYLVTAEGAVRCRYFRGRGWRTDGWPAPGEPDPYASLLDGDFDDDFMDPADD